MKGSFGWIVVSIIFHFFPLPFFSFKVIMKGSKPPPSAPPPESLFEKLLIPPRLNMGGKLSGHTTSLIFYLFFSLSFSYRFLILFCYFSYISFFLSFAICFFLCFSDPFLIFSKKILIFSHLLPFVFSFFLSLFPPTTNCLHSDVHKDPLISLPAANTPFCLFDQNLNFDQRQIREQSNYCL